MDDAPIVECETEGHVPVRGDADVRSGEDIRPIGDLVVFRRDTPKQTYGDTRIIKPNPGKCSRGVVVAAGPKCTEVRVDDVIHVHTWMGEPVTTEEHGDCYTVHEDEIDAVEV